jgi:effector-binding domain-containing protein
MMPQPELMDQAAQPTLTVRARAAVQDLPQVLGKAYGAIAHYLGEVGQGPAGPPFVIYRNMDMQDLDVEMGFPVAQPIAGRGEIKASELPAGKVAACLYIGPYSDMASAYEALKRWIAERGHEPTGVVWEVYLSDPNETPPQELKTQIVFLLK